MADQTVHANQNGNHFDLARYKELLTRCHDNDNDLQCYIEAYREVNKFLAKLSILFAFIVKDVNVKLDILSQLLNSANGRSYKTVASMLDFELNHADTGQKGSRTLLKLHRALNFVITFTDKLKQSHDNESTMHLATESYDATLAKFHPFIVQKAVHVAFVTLPNRKTFFDKFVPQLDANHSSGTELMSDAMQAGQNVFTAIETLFRDKGLLNLK